jgi:putative heme-binding domain-containing protein
MARAGLKQAPAQWLEVLEKSLPGPDDRMAEVVATARALPWGKQRPVGLLQALDSIAQNQKCPAKTRLEALAALPDQPLSMDPARFALLTKHLDADQPSELRALAAEVISRSKLNREQLLAITTALKTTSPMELDRVLTAFTQSSDDQVGSALLETLKASTLRSALRTETLKPRLAKYSAAVQKQAEQLYKMLDADAGKQKEHLDEILATLPAGDVRRGQGIFNNSKIACASCHAIGYLGGQVGPDLTVIGRIRTESDLLEAIVFPSASFVRGYEPMLVNMQDGKVYNGLLRKDAPDEVVLVLGANQEVHLPRADIETMQPSRVSVMPSGLDQQLSRQELADVVAFLKACK